MHVKKCQRCGKCCHSNIGAFIFPSDLIRLSEYLQLTPSNFITDRCEEHILKIKNIDIKIYTLKINDGKCTFLTDNLCEIFNCRPYQCIHAPYNFLAEYSLWSHMSCTKQEEFINLDSSQNDKIIFSELLDNGYKNI